MKIVIPGGQGQIGMFLAWGLQGAGHEVVVLSRSPVRENLRERVGPGGPPTSRSTGLRRAIHDSGRVVNWDGESLGEWAKEIDGADVVINLAGRSVNCRFTPEHRREVMESRTKSTRVVGEAIARAARPPRAWLQASTATIYAHRYDAANDEATGILDTAGPEWPDTWRFSTRVAQEWEKAVNEAATPRTRKVILRTSIVMAPGAGGAFDVMLKLVRFGLGGKNGDGRQYVSWMHDEDFLRAIFWLIEHEELAGPVNLASPNPVPNAEFMRGLREAWGAKVGLPAAKWMIEIGTRLMQTESELVLKSRRVVPGKLLAAGFVFKFTTWPEAARDLCRRWKEERGR